MLLAEYEDIKYQVFQGRDFSWFGRCKGAHREFLQATLLYFSMPEQDSVWEYCQYLQEGHLEVGHNSECFP